MLWLLILTLGLAAGTIGGVVGFGSSVLLMPVLVAAFGPKEAVPIMALAALLANLSRVAVWWREVDWRVNAAYCATAVPAAALGARVLVGLDGRLVEAVLGLFLIGMIPARRWLAARGISIGLAGMAVVGACIGFLTGLVATTGPVNTPFFLAYGLVKGAYISTEAVGSAAIYMAKALVFQRFGALPAEAVIRGLAVGSSLMLGSWLAKHIVLTFDPAQFRVLLEIMMLLAGLAMLWGALLPHA
ncbi:MAG: sulfite exporter TauE/SafE family protein [Hyphomicrobiaceae bacterium]|nr:sulfite exporter TauE/SafE family protein [Hyphomicrobiaceae bacterium]